MFISWFSWVLSHCCFPYLLEKGQKFCLLCVLFKKQIVDHIKLSLKSIAHLPYRRLPGSLIYTRQTRGGLLKEKLELLIWSFKLFVISCISCLPSLMEVHWMMNLIPGYVWNLPIWILKVEIRAVKLLMNCSWFSVTLKTLKIVVKLFGSHRSVCFEIRNPVRECLFLT